MPRAKGAPAKGWPRQRAVVWALATAQEHWRMTFCGRGRTVEQMTDWFFIKKIGTSVTRSDVEQVMGIEPTLPAWEAGVLPLNYTCVNMKYVFACISFYSFFGFCQVLSPTHLFLPTCESPLFMSISMHFIHIFRISSDKKTGYPIFIFFDWILAAARATQFHAWPGFFIQNTTLVF